MSARAVGPKSKKAVKINTTSLYSWNKYLAILHAAQGILILILSSARLFPVVATYLSADTLQTQTQGHPVLSLATHKIFDLNLAYLVAAFFFIAALAHALVATKLRSLYEKDLKQGTNKIRCIEFAFSSAFMVVVVGVLAGVQDVATLIALLGFAAIAGFIGVVLELHRENAKSILGAIVGGVAGLLPWIMVGVYLISDKIYGSMNPAYVYWLFVSVFILFLAIGTNQYLQYRRIGKWADYIYGERIYMILSLVTKAALAWQVFAGILHP